MTRKITQQGSIQAELEEQQRINAGQLAGAVTLYQGKIYQGDGRSFIGTDQKVHMPKENILVHVDTMHSLEKNVIGAAGDPDALEQYASKIYSPAYIEMLDIHDKAMEALENTFSPYQQVLGAAGKAITAFETVRRAEDLTDVVGQQYDLSEYTALNAATIRNSNKLRFKRPRKTSALLQVQKKIGDDIEPENVRQAFTEGEVDIFADATHFAISMRDEIDTTFSPSAQFLQELPGMFARAEDEKIMDVVNALTTGVNVADWGAVTGNFYTNDAAEAVETAIEAIKSYGRTHIGLFASNSLRLYNKNQKAPLADKTDKSTAQPGAKGPFSLSNNPGVTVFVNPNATAGEFTIVAKESFIDFYQAMKIQTSFKNERTAGQTEHRYWFSFNGEFKNTDSAAYQGQSVDA